MQKNRLLRVLLGMLCLALPSALYAYFSTAYPSEAPDYVVMAGIFLPWLIVLFMFAKLIKDPSEAQWTRGKTNRLVICALLTALGVVLGGLLSIPAMPLGGYSLKIGLGVLPVILSAVLFGPAYGGMVGGLTDFLQAMIFPKGAYVPFFTIIGILFGFIPGLFFMRRQEPKFFRILIAVAAGQLIGSVLCNTALLVWLYSMPWEIIIARIINQAVMIPLYTVLVFYCVKLLNKSKVLESLYPQESGAKR